MRKSIDRSSATTRLASHWLWRLRREAERAAILQAVELEILDRVESPSGIETFRVTDAVMERSIDDLRRLLERAPGPSSRTGTPETKFASSLDEGDRSRGNVWFVEDDEDFEPSRKSSSSPARARPIGEGSVSVSNKSAAVRSLNEAVQLVLEDRAEAAITGDAAGASSESFAADDHTSDDNDQFPKVERVSRHARQVSSGLDRDEVLQLVRSYAAAPSAASVATFLMLAEAVERTGHGLSDVLAILRRPKPVIAIVGTTSGFAEALRDLIRHGRILPGKTRLIDGYDLRSPRDLHRPSTSERNVVCFADRDLDDGNALVERQIGHAVQSDYPILLTSDDAERLPQTLLEAADLRLVCGPITPGIIIETMKFALKIAAIQLDDPQHKPRSTVSPADAEDREELASRSTQNTKIELEDETADRLFEGCEALALADLALGIRAGMTPERCIDVLRSLIARRQTDQDGEARKSRKKLSNLKTTGSTKDRSQRNRIGSGSVLIEPQVPAGAGGGKPLLKVETLTGYGEASDWALALKDDLTLWKAGTLPWSDMSTRLLLAGPPGTGKTTFARALGNSLGLPVYATSVSTWLEPSHLGDVLARMAAAFDEAQAAAPCVLFVDEIDGIGRRRGSGRGDHDDYWNAVVNRMLELTDGAIKTDGVLLVGATNNPHAIDPALLRSGRLEKRIDIPLPDVDALVGIFRHHLGEDIDTVLSDVSSPADEGHNPIDDVASREQLDVPDRDPVEPESGCTTHALTSDRWQRLRLARWLSNIIVRLRRLLLRQTFNVSRSEAETNASLADRDDDHGAGERSHEMR